MARTIERSGVMPTPPPMSPYPAPSSRSIVNTPCGPSTQARAPAFTFGTTPLDQSPSALMVNAT